MNIDNSKSYSSETNLHKALSKIGYQPEEYLTVRNREGRWTAVFSFSVHGIQPAHLGFMTMN